MTCPHLALYPWGRDDAAMICGKDGCPCDTVRREMCGEIHNGQAPVDREKEET
jgi:hypothetical protein